MALWVHIYPPMSSASVVCSSLSNALWHTPLQHSVDLLSERVATAAAGPNASGGGFVTKLLTEPLDQQVPQRPGWRERLRRMPRKDCPWEMALGGVKPVAGVECKRSIFR